MLGNILPKCLLLGLPLAVHGLPNCNIQPLSGSQLTIEAYHSSSNWRALTNSDSMVTAVRIEVLSPVSQGSGNMFHLLKDWLGDPIAASGVDSSTVIPLPSGSSLQYYVEHTVGSVYQAQIMLCTGSITSPVATPMPTSPSPNPSPAPSPAPSPTPSPAPSPAPSPTPSPAGSVCSASNIKSDSVPQPCLPQLTGISTSEYYPKWRGKSAITGVSDTGEDCRDLHDRFFVLGDDGMAYHTWHPPTYMGCIFQHEHGDDPKTSNAFDYAEGYPPFGYVSEQWSDREEDHFGHKVVVANDIRMAIGNPADSDATVYDAGIKCQWFSKIHQGSYSADAISNDLHEYFLNFQCDDTQFAENTQFSVKSLVQWGVSNVFDANDKIFLDAASEGTSMLRMPWNNEPDPIPSGVVPSPYAITNLRDHGGGRGFPPFSRIKDKSWKYPTEIAEVELWSGPSGFEGVETLSVGPPGNPNKISFAPYYIVKNPGRFTRQG